MRRAGDAPAILFAAVLGTIAVVAVGQRGLVDLVVMASFGGLVLVGELLRLSAPGGRDFAPVGVGAGLGYAFVSGLAWGSAHAGLLQVIAVIAVAGFAGALPRVLIDKRQGIGSAAVRVLSTSAGAGLFWLAVTWLPADARPALIVVMVGVLVVRFGFDCALDAMYAFSRLGGRPATLLRDEARARLPYSLVDGLLAILLALCVDVVGLPGLLVAVMPVAATQVAFLKWATTRTTRLETVRSLSRIPELGGYVEPGHSRRVGDLAVGIARELGVSETRITDLHLAALMHDIGQVSLVEPVPGGTTSLLAAVDQQRIAHLGAEVIREGGGLEAVATIVEHSADPYRGARGQRLPEVPLASRIIRVANGYDDLVGESPDPEVRLQAIERLDLAMSTDFDPSVTRALGQVIERRQRQPVP